MFLQCVFPGWSIDRPAGVIGSFVLDSGGQESWGAQRSFTDQATIGETETPKSRHIRIRSFCMQEEEAHCFFAMAKCCFTGSRSDEIVRAAVRSRLLQGSWPLKSLPSFPLEVDLENLSWSPPSDPQDPFVFYPDGRSSCSISCMKSFSAGVVQERNWTERNEQNGMNQVSTIQRTLPSLSFNGAKPEIRSNHLWCFIHNFLAKREAQGRPSIRDNISQNLVCQFETMGTECVARVSSRSWRPNVSRPGLLSDAAWVPDLSRCAPPLRDERSGTQATCSVVFGWDVTFTQFNCRHRHRLPRLSQSVFCATYIVPFEGQGKQTSLSEQRKWPPSSLVGAARFGRKYSKWYVRNRLSTNVPNRTNSPRQLWVDLMNKLLCLFCSSCLSPRGRCGFVRVHSAHIDIWLHQCFCVARQQVSAVYFPPLGLFSCFMCVHVFVSYATKYHVVSSARYCFVQD